MSDYSIVNLREIDDSVGGQVEGLEARFSRTLIESRDLGVSLFSYKPGVRPPFAHSHREQEEAYVVVSGSGRVRLGDEVLELRQWDVLRVAPEVVRGFEAGHDGLELIAIGGPKPEGGDGGRRGAAWAGGGRRGPQRGVVAGGGRKLAAAVGPAAAAAGPASLAVGRLPRADADPAA